MEALLERTAISAFIREKKDFYTALFDADGVMAVGSNVPVFGDITGPVFRAFPARHDAGGRPLLVQRLLRLARRGLAFQRPGVPGTRVPRRRALRLRDELGAFRRCRRPPRGLDQPRCHRHLPGRHHHSAGPPDRGRARERDGARDLPSQLAVPRAEPRRHPRADGECRAGRAAHGRDRRPLFRAGGCRCAAAVAGAHATPGARAAGRDVSLRHASLHRRDRFRWARQRPVPHPLRADPRA